MQGKERLGAGAEGWAYRDGDPDQDPGERDQGPEPQDHAHRPRRPQSLDPEPRQSLGHAEGRLFTPAAPDLWSGPRVGEDHSAGALGLGLTLGSSEGPR